MKSSTEFEGDILLVMTADGGDIVITDGLVQCERSFRTAIALSLFGGNEDDPGTVKTDKSFWANSISGTRDDEKITSRFQYTTRRSTLSIAAIKSAISAAALDLQWMKNTGIADEILISHEMQDKNELHLIVQIRKDGTELFTGNFGVHWEAAVHGV